MKTYPECFGRQTPHMLLFGDGSRMVVWASSDEHLSLNNIEELGQKCLFCKNDYMCFETSRNRNFCIAKVIHIT